MEVEAFTPLAVEADLQRLHRAVARDDGDAEVIFDQAPTAGRHVIPRVEEHLRLVLRAAAVDGGPKVRLEMRAATHQDVRTNGVDVRVDALGRVGAEHRPPEAGAKRAEAGPVHHSPHAVDVLRRVRAQVEPRVAEALADEARFDHPLALGVRDVEQHRAAVVEEPERHARRARRLEDETVVRVRVVGAETLRVAQHLVPGNDREPGEVVGASNLACIDPFAQEEVAVVGHVSGGALDRLADAPVPPLEQLLARYEERLALTERGARDRRHAGRPRRRSRRSCRRNVPSELCRRHGPSWYQPIRPRRRYPAFS